MTLLDRRLFIKFGAAWMAGAARAYAFWPFDSQKGPPSVSGDIRGKIFKSDAPDQPWQWSCEAFSYKKMSNGKVACGVCPNRCVLSPGDRSVCRSKVNIKGTLYSLAYGNPCAVHIDPVEKKPLYHFLPGIQVYSLAVAGCNFRCLNCQNWEISQSKPEQVQFRTLWPDQAAPEALAADCQAVAFTYSEPISYLEYMLAIARRTQPAGLKNFWISNGFINKAPLQALCQVIHGANINLKVFSDDIYRRLNGGRLEPVLRTLKTLHAHHVHLEITNLVVPGYTDNMEMVKQMCGWIASNLGPDHPLHFLRFFPRYKLDRLAPTPPSVLSQCRVTAMAEGIRYVYVGNLPGHEGNHTYCHHCGKLIIERQGYTLPQYHLTGDCCAYCRTKIPGVWQERKTGADSTGVVSAPAVTLG
jgi:pyruvate formate lyase activating enzyme